MTSLQNQGTFKSAVRPASLILIVCLLAQDLVFAAGADDPSRVSSPSDIRLSENMAYHRVSQKFPGQEMILNIQDAHQSIDAQKSIAGMLESLVKNYDLKLVGLEGTSGVVDTSILSSFPVEKIRKSAAESFLNESKISAPEFFKIVSNNQVELYGAEDFGLYAENVKDFQALFEERDKILRELSKLNNLSDALAAKILPEDVLRLHQLGAQYAKGEIRFDLYWQKLEELSGKLKISYTGRANISGMARMTQLEKEIDFSAADKERESLISLLSSKLSDREELGRLVAEMLRFKVGKTSPSSFYESLFQRARKAGIGLESFKNLAKYAEYVKVFESIDLVSMMDELQRLEEQIEKGFLRGEETTELNRRIKSVAVFYNLLCAQMSSSDERFYQSHAGDFESGSIQKYFSETAHRHGLGTFDNPDYAYLDRRAAEAKIFYRNVHARNEALLQNFVRRMREKGQTVAALVTGGFHSEGLSELMRQQRISHIVFMPKFGDGEGDRPYIAVITKKNSFLDRQARLESEEEAICLVIGLSVLNGIGLEESKELFLKSLKESRSAAQAGLEAVSEKEAVPGAAPAADLSENSTDRFKYGSSPLRQNLQIASSLPTDRAGTVLNSRMSWEELVGYVNGLRMAGKTGSTVTLVPVAGSLLGPVDVSKESRDRSGKMVPASVSRSRRKEAAFFEATHEIPERVNSAGWVRNYFVYFVGNKGSEIGRKDIRGLESDFNRGWETWAGQKRRKGVVFDERGVGARLARARTSLASYSRHRGRTLFIEPLEKRNLLSVVSGAASGSLAPDRTAAADVSRPVAGAVDFGSLKIHLRLDPEQLTVTIDSGFAAALKGLLTASGSAGDPDKVIVRFEAAPVSGETPVSEGPEKGVLLSDLLTRESPLVFSLTHATSGISQIVAIYENKDTGRELGRTPLDGLVDVPRPPRDAEKISEPAVQTQTSSRIQSPSVAAIPAANVPEQPFRVMLSPRAVDIVLADRGFFEEEGGEGLTDEIPPIAQEESRFLRDLLPEIPEIPSLRPGQEIPFGVPGIRSRRSENQVEAGPAARTAQPKESVLERLAAKGIDKESYLQPKARDFEAEPSSAEQFYSVVSKALTFVFWTAGFIILNRVIDLILKQGPKKIPPRLPPFDFKKLSWPRPSSFSGARLAQQEPHHRREWLKLTIGGGTAATLSFFGFSNYTGGGKPQFHGSILWKNIPLGRNFLSRIHGNRNEWQAQGDHVEKVDLVSLRRRFRRLDSDLSEAEALIARLAHERKMLESQISERLSEIEALSAEATRYRASVTEQKTISGKLQAQHAETKTITGRDIERLENARTEEKLTAKLWRQGIQPASELRKQQNIRAGLEQELARRQSSLVQISLNLSAASEFALNFEKIAQSKEKQAEEKRKDIEIIRERINILEQADIPAAEIRKKKSILNLIAPDPSSRDFYSADPELQRLLILYVADADETLSISYLAKSLDQLDLRYANYLQNPESLSAYRGLLEAIVRAFSKLSRLHEDEVVLALKDLQELRRRENRRPLSDFTLQRMLESLGQRANEYFEPSLSYRVHDPPTGHFMDTDPVTREKYSMEQYQSTQLNPDRSTLAGSREWKLLSQGYGVDAISLLADPNPSRRQIVALIGAEDPAFIPYLLALTHDPEPAVRAHALWALAQFRVSPAAPADMEDIRVPDFHRLALEERELAVRRLLPAAWASTQLPQAVQGLTGLLKGKDIDYVKWLAVEEDKRLESPLLTKSLLEALLLRYEPPYNESPYFWQQVLEPAWPSVMPLHQSLVEALVTIASAHAKDPNVTNPLNEVVRSYRNPESGKPLPAGAILYEIHPIAAIADPGAYAGDYTKSWPMRETYWGHFIGQFVYMFTALAVVFGALFLIRYRRGGELRKDGDQDKMGGELTVPPSAGARLAYREAVRLLDKGEEIELRGDLVALLEHRVDRWTVLLESGNVLDEDDIFQDILNLFHQIILSRDYRLNRILEAAYRVRRALSAEHLQMRRHMESVGGLANLDIRDDSRKTRIENYFREIIQLIRGLMILRAGRNIGQAKRIYEDYHLVHPVRFLFSFEHLNNRSRQIMKEIDELYFNAEQSLYGPESNGEKEESRRGVETWLEKFYFPDLWHKSIAGGQVPDSEKGEVSRRWQTRRILGRYILFFTPLISIALPYFFPVYVLLSLALGFAGGLGFNIYLHYWALNRGLEWEYDRLHQGLEKLDALKKDFERQSGIGALDNTAIRRNLIRKNWELATATAGEALARRSLQLLIVMPGADPAHTARIMGELNSNPLTDKNSGALVVIIPDTDGLDGSFFAALQAYNDISDQDTIEQYLAKVLNQKEIYQANPALHAIVREGKQPGSIGPGDIQLAGSLFSGVRPSEMMKQIRGGVVYCGGSDQQKEAILEPLPIEASGVYERLQRPLTLLDMAVTDIAAFSRQKQQIKQSGFLNRSANIFYVAPPHAGQHPWQFNTALAGIKQVQRDGLTAVITIYNGEAFGLDVNDDARGIPPEQEEGIASTVVSVYSEIQGRSREAMAFIDGTKNIPQLMVLGSFSVVLEPNFLNLMHNVYGKQQRLMTETAAEGADFKQFISILKESNRLTFERLILAPLLAVSQKGATPFAMIADIKSRASDYAATPEFREHHFDRSEFVRLVDKFLKWPEREIVQLFPNSQTVPRFNVFVPSSQEAVVHRHDGSTSLVPFLKKIGLFSQAAALSIEADDEARDAGARLAGKPDLIIGIPVNAAASPDNLLHDGAEAISAGDFLNRNVSIVLVLDGKASQSYAQFLKEKIKVNSALAGRVTVQSGDAKEILSRISRRDRADAILFDDFLGAGLNAYLRQSHVAREIARIREDRWPEFEKRLEQDMQGLTQTEKLVYLNRSLGKIGPAGIALLGILGPQASLGRKTVLKTAAAGNPDRAIGISFDSLEENGQLENHAKLIRLQKSVVTKHAGNTVHNVWFVSKANEQKYLQAVSEGWIDEADAHVPIDDIRQNAANLKDYYDKARKALEDRAVLTPDQFVLITVNDAVQRVDGDESFHLLVQPTSDNALGVYYLRAYEILVLKGDISGISDLRRQGNQIIFIPPARIDIALLLAAVRAAERSLAGAA